MNGEEIQTKLAILRENLDKLSRIPQATIEEFLSDFRNVDAALHLLQTSIQALLDIGSFKLACLGLEPPRSSRGLLERLEEAGALPKSSAERFGPIFGFRNRVVLLYDRMDARIVYRILTEEKQDLRDLLELLLEIDGLDHD